MTVVKQLGSNQRGIFTDDDDQCVGHMMHPSDQLFPKTVSGPTVQVGQRRFYLGPQTDKKL